MAQYDMELDLSEVAAPLHLLRARKALARLDVGQTLMITVSARRAVRDFQAMAEQSGDVLLDKKQLTNGTQIVLRKT